MNKLTDERGAGRRAGRTSLTASIKVLLTGPGLIVGATFPASPATAQPPAVEINRPPLDVGEPCLFLPKVSFGPPSQSIGLGASATLSWSVQSRGGCHPSLSMAVLGRPQINLSPGVPQDWAVWTSVTGVTARQGSLQVQPAFNSVYMLVVAWGPNSSIYSTPIQVAVNLPVANRNCLNLLTRAPREGRLPGLPCRNRVTINANNLAPLLVQALGTPNTTVIVADGVELNLSPYLGSLQDGVLGGPISIKDGVQLFGGRVAEPGKPFRRGPRLFVTPNPNVRDQSHWPNPLLQIDGNYVRISGVRVEGPGPPPDAWKPTLPQNQIGYTKGIRFVDKIGIEIDHNEFSGWNTAAVEPVGALGDRVWQTWTSKVTADSSGIHYPAGLEPVNIHDNYFHSNWYPRTPAPWSACSRAHSEACTPYLGYGVVASGTHVRIERNAFDDYYHAIAANGCPGSGYRAYRNLVLKNGGGAQAFDAHYRRPSCGQPSSAAGHDFDIRLNSFLYRDGAALYINGTPDVGAFVSHNVFANNRVKDDAVRLGTHGNWTNVWLDGTNSPGVRSWFDASHFSADCDFDGDGFNDSFITTGETWWFQSRDNRNGPTPWVYLNTSRLLVENVTLGYFSADALRNHVCDVYVFGGGYKGGTGEYGPLN